MMNLFTMVFSDLEIIGCEIFNNTVQAHGGAIGLFEGSSPLILNNSIHNLIIDGLNLISHTLV